MADENDDKPNEPETPEVEAVEPAGAPETTDDPAAGDPEGTEPAEAPDVEASPPAEPGEPEADDTTELDEPDAIGEFDDSAEPEPDDTDEQDEATLGEGEPESRAGPAGRKAAIVAGIVVGVIACLVAVVLWAGSGGDDDPDDDTPAAEEPGTGDVADDTTDTTPPPDDEPAGEQEAAAFLSDIEPVESEHWEPDESGDVTIGGDTYANTVVSGPIGGCDDGAAQVVEYALGGGYTRLSGTVGLADSSPPNLGVEISFEADGAEIYWRSFVRGDASRVQLDLTGVQQLTITAARVFAGDECVQAAFADLALS